MKYKRFFLNKINQVFIDAFVFILSYGLAFFIRFEKIPSGINLKQLILFFPYIALTRILSFYFFSVYSIIWRYVSITDVLLITKACLPVSAILLSARLFLPERFSSLRIPLGVIVLEFLLVLLGTLGVRLTRRVWHEMSERENLKNKKGNSAERKVLLIGAGNAGNMVIRELKQRKDLGIRVLGFIDDDPKKFNTIIQGVKVLGNAAQIPGLVKKYGVDEAIISIANASSKDIRRIVDVCEGTKIKVKIIPGLYEMFDEKIKISKIREINIDDLLGRSVINFENNLPQVIKHYKNKRVLVTGAGGSIGLELCKQLASLWPKELIAVDKDENSIYELESELNREFNGYELRTVIADIRNYERLRSVFKKYSPQILFHAAAHKHVPLMEYNVSEAILNNVLGTKNVVDLANQNGLENFIYISTDKAINPTSIMGASKKIGEIIIQEIAAKSTTRFSCVRFGNVLGSRGSVVPLFQKQIAEGGPITITHPEVERYFMSISEAVQLIIQAGTIGNKGEILVLDMGEPIKIKELARDLIKLSGYKEDDFEIRYIGLRPGEKLIEEILVDEERAKATQFEKIFIAPPNEIDGEDFSSKLSELISAAKECNERKILFCLKDISIGYKGESRE